MTSIMYNYFEELIVIRVCGIWISKIKSLK